MSTLSRTPVQDLEVSAPEVVALCGDLLFATRYEERTNYDLQLYRWFMWFFHEQPAKTLTASLFPPHSALVMKVGKLGSTPLFTLCQELARQHRLVLEAQEGGNVLTFLKRIHRKLG